MIIKESFKSLFRGFFYTLGKILLWAFIGYLLYLFMSNSDIDIKRVVYPI